MNIRIIKIPWWTHLICLVKGHDLGGLETWVRLKFPKSRNPVNEDMVGPFTEEFSCRRCEKRFKKKEKEK